MRKCPFCAESVQENALRCRFCGESLRAGVGPQRAQVGPTLLDKEKLAEIRRLQRIASGPRTRKDSMRMAKGVLCFVIIGAIFVYVHQWRRLQRNRPTAVSEQWNVSYRAFNAIFGPDSPLSAVEMEEEFGAFRGAAVTWKGTVNYVNLGVKDELYVTVRHRAAARTSDVLVRFRESGREDLQGLRSGEQVQYEGRIDDYGKAAAFITLTEGSVVSVDR